METNFKEKVRTLHGAEFENQASLAHPLMSWRSVIAGFIITFFIYATFMALGLALGLVTFRGTDFAAQASGVVTGAWFVVSCVISQFCGSYFAARVSKLHMTRLAGSQGILISGLFFAAVLWRVNSLVMLASPTEIARDLQSIGGGMFAAMILGAASSYGGGFFAAYRNVQRPLVVGDIATSSPMTGVPI